VLPSPVALENLVDVVRVVAINDREERRADVAVSLCLHDALDRLLVLEEDNVGVTAVVVADQDSAEDSVLLS
jgi:hypothetical protein